MLNDLLIIQNDLLEAYFKEVPTNLQQAFDDLHDAELSTANFSFYTSVSSVYSSKIEGEDIELDSFIRYKRDGIHFRADYTQKIDDLYNAYIFAQTHQLNEANIDEAHRLLSQHLLQKNARGVLRMQNMYVSTPDGKIEYVAALPGQVKEEMAKFYTDLGVLVEADLSVAEVFFQGKKCQIFSRTHHTYREQ